jgi:hypothetical protein
VIELEVAGCMAGVVGQDGALGPVGVGFEAGAPVGLDRK